MQRNCGHSVPECRLNRVAFRQTPSHPSEEAVKNWCFFAELKAEDVTWQVEATDLTPAIAEDLLVRAAPLVTLYTYSARSASLGETEARSN